MAQSVCHVAEERPRRSRSSLDGREDCNRTHDDAMQTGTTLSQSMIDDELRLGSNLVSTASSLLAD